MRDRMCGMRSTCRLYATMRASEDEGRMKLKRWWIGIMRVMNTSSLRYSERDIWSKTGGDFANEVWCERCEWVSEWGLRKRGKKTVGRGCLSSSKVWVEGTVVAAQRDGKREKKRCESGAGTGADLWLVRCVGGADEAWGNQEPREIKKRLGDRGWNDHAATMEIASGKKANEIEEEKKRRRRGK